MYKLQNWFSLLPFLFLLLIVSDFVREKLLDVTHI